MTIDLRDERLGHEPDWAALLASAPRPMTAEWLRSPAYDALMQRWRTRDDVLDEAQRMSRSYQFRHATAAPALGVWRWRGMHEHRELLLGLLSEGRVVDFGGAAAPLGLGSVVVDQGDPSPGQWTLDAVFTSHTLEHVDGLEVALRLLRAWLKPGGKLVAHVPAWTCERWRAGVHTSEDHGAHRWTFGLSSTPVVKGRHYVNADQAARDADFRDVRAWYCGDNSIMLIGEKA